ncbi:MAG: DinB family protein [Saprospiraceae bacterium]
MHPSYQSILGTLEQERMELFDLLRVRGDEELNQTPGPGKWSAIQVMHHLIISEELSLKYVRKKLSFNPALQKAGFSEKFRRMLLKIYLGLPFKFKAPKGVNDEALPSHVSFSETAQRWDAIRSDLAGFLEGVPRDLFDKELYKHPAAGKMTLNGMLDFYLAHFRRHREQIIRMLV